MIYNYTLKNRIRVIVNKLEGVYSVAIGILVGAGSAYELPEENGISHFIEHVNFKGTEKRTAFDISNHSDMLGAQLNAFTSKEYTCYYIKTITEHTQKSFEILADLFVNSVYDKEELDRERGVIIEEINMYEDTPDELCSDLLAGAYFGDSGYGATILGSKNNISKFTKNDILNYKNKYYTTDNIVVSITGGVDQEAFLELCEKYLGGLKPSNCSLKPVRNTQNLQQSVSKNKDIEQVHIAIACPGVKTMDENVDGYSVISSVLGGGMSSRLFQSVRESLGLCYSVYSYMSAYADCGYNIVYAGVSRENIKPCYDAILDQMQKLKSAGITEEEFIRSREQMKASLVFTQENTVSQMLLYGKRLLSANEVYDFKDRLDKINKMTKDSVNGLIDRLFNINSLAKAIVGKDVSNL